MLPIPKITNISKPIILSVRPGNSGWLFAAAFSNAIMDATRALVSSDLPPSSVTSNIRLR